MLGRVHVNVFLASGGASTEDPLLMSQQCLAAGGWRCMCMLGVQRGGTKFDQTFLLPLKVLQGS